MSTLDPSFTLKLGFSRVGYPGVQLEQFLKRRYSNFRQARQFLVKEIEVNGLPLAAWKWPFLLRGFHSDKRYLYQLGADRRPLPTYLSDFARLRTRRLNGAYRKILDHKWMFKEAVAGAIRCPRTVATIGEDGATEMLGERGEVVDRVPLSAALERFGGPVVAKRFDGGGGKKIFRIERRGSAFTVNGAPMSATEIELLLGRQAFMVEEAIQQAAYAEALYPHSVNTIRILTVNDGRSSPWIAFAVQRIGRAVSAPTDNFNRGGLCAAVDLETGALGEALHFTKDARPATFQSHPETGARIQGTLIPNWAELRRWLLDFVDRFPGFAYVGWDVVVLQSGFMLLEGNSYSGVQLIQSHRPLLESGRFAEYLLNAGIISRRQFQEIRTGSTPQLTGQSATP